jgi:replication fork protection complex subunit Tof1/Swi1
VVKADDEINRVALFKNGYLRLLMTLVGMQRAGLDDDPDASWVIPSTMSADQIKEAHDLVKKFEFSPPVFDDGKEAGDFIRRKSAGAAPRKRAVFDDEDDGIDDDEEELLFPAGGPTIKQKSADALEALKKKRRRRRREGTDEDDGITDEVRAARAAARKQRELEKNRKIKSELFIRDSDDETDEERDRIFFEQEEKLRKANKINIMKELLGLEKPKDTEAPTKKRQSSAISADSDDDDDLLGSSRRPRQASTVSLDDDDEVAEASERSSPASRDNVLDASEDEATDTPMSSPHAKASQTKRRKLSRDAETASPNPSTLRKDEGGDAMSDDDDDDDVAPVARQARQRVRAGFIVDSSDDE